MLTTLLEAMFFHILYSLTSDSGTVSHVDFMHREIFLDLEFVNSRDCFMTCLHQYMLREGVFFMFCFC